MRKNLDHVWERTLFNWHHVRKNLLTCNLPQVTTFDMFIRVITFLVSQFSFMAQGKTMSPKLSRSKSKTATFSTPLNFLTSCPKNTKNKGSKPGVHPKSWTFLCLQSGVWHQVATTLIPIIGIPWSCVKLFKWHK